MVVVPTVPWGWKFDSPLPHKPRFTIWVFYLIPSAENNPTFAPAKVKSQKSKVKSQKSKVKSQKIKKSKNQRSKNQRSEI
jgi:hypothetical protein